MRDLKDEYVSTEHVLLALADARTPAGEALRGSGAAKEPLLKALIEGKAGIETLSIERPGLHDAFVAIAGESAAREMGQPAEATE